MGFAYTRQFFLRIGFAVFWAVTLVLGSGCGLVRRAAVRDVAGLLSGASGSRVFMEDDDPELIREALPFALKTYEALLAAEPKNRDLYLATADAFVKYANAFVQTKAEELEEVDFQRAEHLRQRAGKLYLRGRGYAMAGMALDHPAFEKQLRQDPHQALQALSAEDVPLLFTAAAGWAGAISANVSNMSLVAELPIVEAMMRRALALDEDFDSGAIHEFFILYEGGRSEAMGGSAERALEHFNRTIALTQGQKASPYVALASSVAVRKQDYKMFKDLLDKALAIDPDSVPEWRLANILAQEKARWLLRHSGEFFLNYEETQP